MVGVRAVLCGRYRALFDAEAGGQFRGGWAAKQGVGQVLGGGGELDLQFLQSSWYPHVPGGVLVGLAGLAVIAVGVGLIVYGAKRKFEDKLQVGQMSQRIRMLARRLGQLGYIAKGIAFAIVGVLLLDAALTHNPAKSRGLDAALRTLVHQPYGVFLLIAVGIGFAAFGVYCFIQSRYRKVGS